MPTSASVAAYIATLSDKTKRADAKSLVKIMQTASGEKPRMWGPSIIGFGSHHYRYESGREGDMPIIAFSPRKAAIVLYIASRLSGSGSLLSKLGKHSMGKGCLYIKKLADVDERVLKVLVDKAFAALKPMRPKP
jgi:hypothetical protein